MSKHPDDGGPAFPQPPMWPMTSSYGGAGYANFGHNPLPVLHQPGMSLRDYIAAHVPASTVGITRYSHLSLAASALLIGKKAPIQSDIKREPTPEEQLQLLDFWNEVEAVLRYRQADAMLVARTRSTEQEG